MLYTTNDASTYVQEFKKRFTNFCEKAPLLISFTITPVGVQVVDEAKNLVLEFSFDYSIPVKSFIFGIKQRMIRENCYPVIRHTQEVDRVRLEASEIAERMAQGESAESIPLYETVSRTTSYLIDKVIIFKDHFVLRDLDTEKLYLYKMNKSSVFFLQKLRNRKFNAETAANYFFSNSTLLNEIETKGDDEAR